MNPKLIEILPTLSIIENPEDINESTRIEQDLRIYGFQARRLLMVYSDEFDVNIAGFRFHKYFSGDNAFYRLYSRLFKGKKETLTMGDLEAAIPYKKLTEKVLNDIAEKRTEVFPHKEIHLKTRHYFKTNDIAVAVVMVAVTAIILGLIGYYLT